MTALRAPAIEASPHAPPSARADAHLPALDGVRCLAIALVVWEHSGPLRGVRAIGWHGVGMYGVWLFFTLSAYLITGILLRSRDFPLIHALRVFYVRRILRIVPVYVLFLAVAVALGVPMLPGELTAHATYLTNWYMIARDAWPPTLPHLWSLAVEEQFYLVWPFLVLLIPARWLPRLFVTGIVVAVVTRFVVVLSPDWSPLRTVVSTVANLDALGLGALLAWFHHQHRDPSPWVIRSLAYGLTLIALCVLVTVTVGRTPLFGVTETLSGALVSVWLVHHAATARAGPLIAVLNIRAFRAVGTISYGIYLWHELPLWALRRLQAVGNLPWTTSGHPLHLLVVCASTLALASLSWRYFEAPINAQKRRFPYARPTLPDLAHFTDAAAVR